MRRLVIVLAMLLVTPGWASAQQPMSTHSNQEAAKKSFVRSDLDSDAVRTRAAVRQEMADGAKGKTADQLYAEGIGDTADADAALERFGAAIAAGRDDGTVWLNFANAADAAAANVKDDDERKSKLQGWATAGAYIAYRRATSRRDEAVALSTLGAFYAERESWRPALDSYRASLKLIDRSDIRKTYDAMRAEHGFRISDYKIDSDAASARVCFQFSEALAKGRTDLASYVAVDGTANAAVSVEDQQLCVEGLNHGQRYAIVVRQGLPSAVEEDLLKSADYDIYVRDRSPQVRFVGKTYVLPRVGAEGVPVVSVNTPKVDIQVLRIGDRSLVPTVRSDDFLSQLYAYRLNSISGTDGSKVWSGTLDVEQRLNEDVTTAFPVLEAVGKMAPGIYVMRASAHSDLGQGDTEGQQATQWFVVSDLGLTALSSGDGVTALVRSLATARPIAGVELRLMARNNDVLATKTTDDAGMVRFDPGLSRGTGGNAPAVVVASSPGGSDYDFLDLGQSPFDLTDRGVKGRTPPAGLDAFVYAERGVYRPGETVFLTALLRDAAGQAVSGAPLTLVIKRPDGVEDKRVATADGGSGGHALSLPLLAGAASGTWRVEVFADPKGEAIGETSFLVEDYVPERLAVDLTPEQKALVPGEGARVDVRARFLYGAPAKGLAVSGETVVEAAGKPAWPALEGYETGLNDEAFETVTTPLPEGLITNAEGAAAVTAPVPQQTATRPIEAKIILRVGEPGGRAVERTGTLPILPNTASIGVKKTFGTVGEGGNATFDVVAVGADGKRMARAGLHWSLYRLNNDYQWYSDGGRWNYERVKSSKRIANGTVDAASDVPGRIEAAVGFGSHRLDVTSDDGSLAPTSVTFEVGWSGDATAQTPDLLEVTLDKAAYAPGETIRAAVRSRFAGQATLAIANGRVQALQTIDLKVGDNSFALPVEQDWGVGAYAVVLAHRPLDAKARRMPGRAVGLAWFGIDPGAHRLDVAVDLPAKIEPRSTLAVPIHLAGLAAGEEAEVTVSAVDVGILNLTRYQTPDPAGHFYGQRALGTDIRDVYGFLIDGLGLTRGAIRSGGDSGAELASEKPTQAPLALYSGIVKVGADGTATVTFDIPAFNGTVRVAAVAWSKTRAGSAQADLIVRDPVVVAASLPRFLNLGDRARARFDIDNVEGSPGAYTLGVDPSGPWLLQADSLTQRVDLGNGQRASFEVPFTAAGLGPARLGARLAGPGLDVAQEVGLTIEPGAPTVYRRDVRTLAPGGQLAISSDLLAEFVPGSGTVSVAVSPVGGIDVPALLLALDRYPAGCSEQIVSRALPLLYVNKLAPPDHLALDEALPARINNAVATLLSRQTSEGGFGLWSASSEGDDLWLDSYVADFLTRAREAGYVVPARAFDAALDKLRNSVAATSDAKGDDALAQSYAFYVLARNGRPVLGDLHYLAATGLGEVSTPLGKAQIGAALALLGDATRANEAFSVATAALESNGKEARVYRSDYGSRLRDAAAVLALMAESGLKEGIGKAGAAVERAQATPYPTSTQEEAWLILAAQAVETQAKGIALTLDGQPHAGALYRTWTARRLDNTRAAIANAGLDPVRLILTLSGQLPNPEPAAAHGYALERRYYKLDGTEVDPSIVTQNDRLVVVLKATEDTASKSRLLLTDPLPAGFEIDNPELVTSGSVANLPFLSEDVTPAHIEFRDDRFTAAFDRDTEQPAFFAVAYIVRAVTPGHFVHPPATIEDMYRPERFGRTGSGLVEIRPAQ